jgi:hypothetical protein
VNVYETYRITLCILAVGMAIFSLEQVVARRQFQPGGLSSWDVLSLKRPPKALPWLNRALAPLCDYPGVERLLWLRLASVALILFAGGIPFVFGPAIFIALLTTSVLLYRNSYGTDGSDQMGLIVLVVATVYAGSGFMNSVGVLGLWFICLQVTLAYAAAGISKLFSETWRGGSAMFLIMNTGTYGTRMLAQCLRRSVALQVVSAWGVMGFETLFPLTLLASPPFLYTFLVIAFAFHLGCSLFMGLNSFLWAFASAYPAVLFCYASLH